MKRILTYIIIYPVAIMLLLPACQKEEVPVFDGVAIDEFMVRTEQLASTKAYTGGEIEKFDTNDSIRVFGFFKAASSSTRGLRFMPAHNDSVGATYIYEKDVLGWHRFVKQSNVGAWRSGFYHDFTAYYLLNKPESKEVEYIMDSKGLAHEELLWGETKNEYFSGAAQIIPQITFQHQLSRIKVRVLHDMDTNASDAFSLTEFRFTLDNKEAVFNVETGEWSNSVTPEDVELSFELNPSVELRNTNRLKPIDAAECWVLPGRTISDFNLRIKNDISEKEEEVEVKFKSHSGFTNEVKTKAGYITILQLELTNLKPIIFTVSLTPWNVEKHLGEISDD